MLKNNLDNLDNPAGILTALGREIRRIYYSRIEATGLIMCGWKPARFRQKAMGGFGGGFCNVLIFMASCFCLLLQGVVRK